MRFEEHRVTVGRIQDTQQEIERRDALLQGFGEACEATVDAHTAEKAESVRQKEAASVATISALRKEGRIAPVPVMDMRFCIDNLDAIRSEAGGREISCTSTWQRPQCYTGKQLTSK